MLPKDIYEIVAHGARYWFLFLMILITWRSYRWLRRDQKQAKKRRKLLPDAGFVGEMIVLSAGGAKNLERGSVLPVPTEGTLGSLRTNDLSIPAQGVAKRHLWFRFEENKGLRLQTMGKAPFSVDGAQVDSHRDTPYMAHGSILTVGGCELRLRLFAGFESTGYAQRREFVETPQAAEPPMDMAAMQQWMLQQQWLMQQQAYEQGYRQAMQQMEPVEEEEEELLAENELPYDVAQIAQAEGMVDHSLYQRPADQPPPVLPSEEPTFYPPEMDDFTWDDEDMTDAAAPPKSAYVGHDAAAAAKKHVWDKYFGGGRER